MKNGRTNKEGKFQQQKRTEDNFALAHKLVNAAQKITGEIIIRLKSL